MPRIIDLTHTLEHGMRGVAFETAMSLQQDGWNARTLHLYSHAGTHMDAPRHFLEAGETLDHLDLQKCIGPAWVIDLTHLAPRTLITVDHLGDFQTRIASGDRVLLRTDWSDHLGKPDYRTHFPRVSLELARWFAERPISLLGVEPPSVADVNDISEVTDVHRTLLRAKIVIVESLCHLDQLTQKRISLVALPLNVRDGDGSPARVIALEA